MLPRFRPHALPARNQALTGWSPAQHQSRRALYRPAQHQSTMAMADGNQQQQLDLGALGVSDAHCHAQDDPQWRINLSDVSAARLAAMGVREDDWDAVKEMHKLHPTKVIPCFGVHPWFAHLHATQHEQHQDVRLILDVPAKDSIAPWLLQVHPSLTWEAKLRENLEQFPASIVGEFGLDRSAVILGTKIQVSFAHQLALTETHLRLAAQLSKPVSMHCVRGYGHLQDLLRKLGPEHCPPKIMLHSFGGGPELVVAFTRGLANGIGPRVYFSFSAAINAGVGRNREKLLERVRAVPDNRLLIESDQNTPRHIDDGLLAILCVVAEAKGWPLLEAARITTANFNEFYKCSLQHMARHMAAAAAADVAAAPTEVAAAAAAGAVAAAPAGPVGAAPPAGAWGER